MTTTPTPALPLSSLANWLRRSAVHVPIMVDVRPDTLHQWANEVDRACIAQASAARVPSDAEILHKWDTYVGEPSVNYPFDDDDKINFARALFAGAGSSGGSDSPAPAQWVSGLTDEQIIRAAVAAMPHAFPNLDDDLLDGFAVHIEAEDIVAVWKAAAPSTSTAEAESAESIDIGHAPKNLSWSDARVWCMGYDAGFEAAGAEQPKTRHTKEQALEALDNIDDYAHGGWHCCGSGHENTNGIY